MGKPRRLLNFTIANEIVFTYLRLKNSAALKINDDFRNEK